MIKVDFSNNIDSFGLICKRQTTGFLEGGDTAANECTRLICEFVLGGKTESFMQDYSRVMDMLEYLPGCWRRHPDVSMWYAQPGMDRWSRDQSIPSLCLMALVGDLNRARNFYRNHMTRWLLYMPNSGHKNGVWEDKVEHYKKSTKTWSSKKWFGDPTLFEYNALLIRACRFEDKYRWLRFFDYETLLSSYYKKYVDYDRDVRNHVLVLITTSLAQPTWASRKAASVFADRQMLDTINYWFGLRSLGEPALHKLLVPAARQVLMGDGF